MQLCTDEWPEDRSKVPAKCLPFWTFRDQISFNAGVLFKGEKMIIPKTMQPEMLKLIHSSHLGIEKCKGRARDVLQECHHRLKNSLILSYLYHLPKMQLKGTFAPTQCTKPSMGKSCCRHFRDTKEAISCFGRLLFRICRSGQT